MPKKTFKSKPNCYPVSKQFNPVLQRFTQFKPSLRLSYLLFLYSSTKLPQHEIFVLCVNPDHKFAPFCHVCLGQRCWGFRGGPQGRPGFVSFSTSSTSISKYCLARPTHLLDLAFLRRSDVFNKINLIQTIRQQFISHDTFNAFISSCINRQLRQNMLIFLFIFYQTTNCEYRLFYIFHN